MWFLFFISLCFVGLSLWFSIFLYLFHIFLLSFLSLFFTLFSLSFILYFIIIDYSGIVFRRFSFPKLVYQVLHLLCLFSQPFLPSHALPPFRMPGFFCVISLCISSFFYPPSIRSLSSDLPCLFLHFFPTPFHPHTHCFLGFFLCTPSFRSSSIPSYSFIRPFTSPFPYRLANSLQSLKNLFSSHLFSLLPFLIFLSFLMFTQPNFAFPLIPLFHAFFTPPLQPFVFFHHFHIPRFSLPFPPLP